MFAGGTGVPTIAGQVEVVQLRQQVEAAARQGPEVTVADNL
jgi:hypothetical protein